MRVLGAFLLVSGFILAIGYLLYWFFSDVDIPLPFKIAIAVIAIGFLLLLISISRERYKTSKEEDFKEVER